MDPVAPNQSERHLALRHNASSAGMEHALRQFLWEINAHWELISLPLICENLQEILELAQDKWQLDLDEWGIETWPDVLDWVIEDVSYLTSEVGTSFAQGFSDRGNHPLMGVGILRHPLYATLCNSHSNPMLNEALRLLQAHLLFAHINVIRQYTTIEEFESYSEQSALLEKSANPYHAALAIRSMSEGSTPDLFRVLPVELPPLQFLSALYPIIPSTAEDIVRYRHLITFFEKAFRNLEQQQRDSHTRPGASVERARVQGGRTNFLLAALSSDSPIDEIEPTGSERRGRHSTTVRKRHTGAEAEERNDVDDSPDEDEEDEEIDRTSFEDPGFEKNPGSFQQVSAAQAMQVQMANQMFPWTYGSLTAAEIAPLIVQRSQAMAQIVSGGRVLTTEEADELEVLAFAQVMFWTSSSAGQAKELKLPNKSASGKNARLGLLSSTSEKLAQWRVRAPLPAYRRPQEDVPVGMDRGAREYLQLEDVADGSSLVLAFVDRINQVSASEDIVGPSTGLPFNHPERVFWRPLAWYRRRLRALFELSDCGTRMTEGRLSKFMFRRVLGASGGDLSATAIITGNDVPLSRVKLFYACPSVSRLQQIYTGVSIEVRNELWRALGKTPPRPAGSVFQVDATYIGNRHCPTRSAVKEAIRRVRQEIENLWQAKTDAEHQRHHNLLTLYTLWMFSYTTGVRGIRTPYVNLAEIDPILRLATLTDKDSGVGYKTRLVRVTPMLLQQMELYNELVSRSPQIQRSHGLPCFLLDGELKPVEVRPRTIVPVMREFFPFAVNIHRRFVSSELLDAGCPPEIVSAWMGHWHRGEEPWGKYSSFSFSDFTHVLESFLDPLLDSLGFVPMSAYSRPKSRGRK